jgi:NAD(P)-dependent dehydrogenase (short-subunit alcohol dehydrogenase family)
MTTQSSSSIKRVWFITGAARGLGALIADAALADGNAVVVAGRNLAALTKRFGDSPNALPVLLDVTDETQARAAARAAIARFGHIDVLINNAGFGLLGAVEEADDADVRRMYDTNVFGLLNVTRAVLPYMRERKAGHVVNISSVGGYRSGAGFGVYCSTKFAVEGLTEALHDELAPLGIHATVVEPGYFRTDFLDASSLVKSQTVIADYAETAGKVREHAVQVNHQQPGDPTRLAKAMVTLIDAERPPLRMPFGTDTLAAVASKNAYVAEETAAWSELAASTDFPK